MSTVNTEICLEVVGLCLVVQREEASHHVVVAVEPPAGPPDIPPHQAYLTFSRTALSRTEGAIPPFAIAQRSYNRIDGSMFQMAMPPRSNVVLSDPTSPLVVHDPIEYPPAALSDLGFGPLKPDVGSGDWQDGENVRFFLPKAKARSGWGELLGEYTFPAQGTDVRLVADLFFWRANFGGPCRFSLQDYAGNETGAIFLDGAESAQVRIACYSDSEPETDRPFDYSTAYARLCDGGAFQKPDRQNPGFGHPGSGACPPNKGP